MKTIDEHISNAVDDVEENILTHAIDYDNWYLYWSVASLAGGWIFKDVKILKLCEIVSAELRINHVSWLITRGIAFFNIYGWKVCDILNWQFPPLDHTPSGCPRTIAFTRVEYTGAKVALEDFCRWQKIADVTAIVQELVNQKDWRKKHDIAFCVPAAPSLPRGSHIKICMKDHPPAGMWVPEAQLVVEVKPRVLLNESNAFQSPVY